MMLAPQVGSLCPSDTSHTCGGTDETADARDALDMGGSGAQLPRNFGSKMDFQADMDSLAQLPS